MNLIKQIYLYSLLLIFFLFSSHILSAQFRVLLYTETGGYNHGTEQVSKTLFDSLGTEHNFTVDLDNTGDTFTEIDSLSKYKIVIWANTSGSNILNAVQQSNFEQYMTAGGNMMGLHAATDTYRHSTSNGSWTGLWDWYAETLGASVQTGPNHTANLHNNFMDHMTTHQVLDSLPNPWQHAEEYYYWENGYFDSLNNHILLKVRTTDLSGSANSYDSARAIAWIKDHIGGGKVFYTALGHNKSSYENDFNFKVHLRDAVLSLSAPASPVLNLRVEKPSSEKPEEIMEIHGNPFQDHLELSMRNPLRGIFQFEVMDLRGSLISAHTLDKEEDELTLRINTKSLAPGVYFLNVYSKDYTFARRIMKY